VFVNRYFYPDHSATSQLLSDLAFELSAKGYSVLLLCSNRRYDDSVDLGKGNVLSSKETINGVSVERVWSTNFGRSVLLGRLIDYFSFYCSILFRVSLRAKKGDIVVVKTDPPLLGVFLAPVLAIKKAKQVNWFQDLFPEVASQLSIRGLSVDGYLAIILRSLRDWNCRIAVLNIAISGGMSSYLAQRGISQSKIKVIPNWGPKGVEPVALKDNSLRRSWSLDEKFVVGYSGNLGRAHDWRWMHELAVTFSDRIDVSFVFIGGGAGMVLLKAECAASNLTNVMFMPYQSRQYLADSLSVIDLHLVTLQTGMSDFIVPSKVYGIIAVGRPFVFVGDRSSEVVRILDENGFGRAFELDKFDDIKDYVIDMSLRSATYVQAEKNASQFASDKYSFSAALAQWEAVLAELTLEIT
jgi:glycosyltransferase involved in cell wall biosynthesis